MFWGGFVVVGLRFGSRVRWLIVVWAGRWLSARRLCGLFFVVVFVLGSVVGAGCAFGVCVFVVGAGCAFGVCAWVFVSYFERLWRWFVSG